MNDYATVELVALVLAAVGVGFAKTAIGGVASMSVALFATVLPARESTGALLPLLLVGDVVAVAIYRQHADWQALLRLFPSVVAGIAVGVVFVAGVGDLGMRRMIGAVLLVLVGVHLLQRWRRTRQHDADAAPTEQQGHRHAIAAVFGVLAGFTTMVANAGGAVMSLYLLSAGFGMLGFLGTSAWFFFAVNLFKVPFSVGLDLISVDSLVLDAWLVPAVLLGAFIGRQVVHRIDQSRFETLILATVVLSSVYLVS